ncbi:putative fatty acid synthase subunit beta [Macrophomina phaseolina]|uniref:Fatty acid synthase subunit beta n=1 Tax=Macrophomina phaseolina TaxID=35725 RepID=A0ABQ8GU68_9PEZI|nr:putative fatty acid synthase subunit beta [Macrophomina phaseolina]
MSSSASTSSASSPLARLHLVSAGVKCALDVDSSQLAPLAGHGDEFINSLHGDEHPPSSPASLALRFIAYLESTDTTTPALTSALSAFETRFLTTTDIHTLALSQPGGTQQARMLLRSYYEALFRCSRKPIATSSALLDASAASKAHPFLIFGGQGAANPGCFQELRGLISTYRPLVHTLISTASPVLFSLSRDPATNGFYAGRELDLDAWLADPDVVPESDFLASAAVSFPIIGLVGLAHYCITCQVLGKTPGEFRKLLRGVTGHSQGLVVAAAVAQCSTWDEFYAVAQDVLELLFWTGFESHTAAPRSALSDADIKDSIEHGEGRPGLMLSVRGLRKSEVHDLVDKCNARLPENARICVALQNTQDNFTLAGPARSLRGFCLHVRPLQAEDGVDQSRVPYRKRKKAIKASFLPISAPFHSKYLAKAAERIKDQVPTSSLSAANMAIPVYHTKDGQDLRSITGRSITDILVNAVCTDFVDWPASLKLPGASHIITLATGRLGDVVEMVKQGEGIIVLNAATIAEPDAARLTKVDLFAAQLPAEKLSAPSWSDLYRPRLVKSENDEVQLDTKLSRVLGTPPVFTAGMTPTTVHWDFVSAVMNAGYHIEMAGGGYFSPTTLSAAITQLAQSIPRGRGITLNLIYASPESMRWQIALLQDLQRKGTTAPIDGLTIGAGVPSPDIASSYITSLNLKHIAFKPGSHDSIRQTLAIADAHPRFPVLLQWTGGRGGGHHSYEDFHAPILDTYAEIRARPNVVLVAGSGFGDAAGIYPYLSGEWAQAYGRAPMPFDGALLGSRMMVAREAHTAPESREVIVAAPGLESERDWDRTYDGPAGGVVTVQSEMGQPIHKIATRGVKLWAEMDKTVFSLPRAQRPAALEKQRRALIARLNADYAKPWFGVDAEGTGPAELAEMPYARVVKRLLELMYLPHRGAFIDPSYEVLLRDVAQRALDRLHPGAEPLQAEDTAALVLLIGDFEAVCPGAETQTLHPEDERWFVRRCKARGMKPVNFIPALDEDFEFFFKKDSLWQSENVDAVVGRDAGRVCILQSPVSVRYSTRADESAKEILDGITGGLVERVKNAFYGGNDVAIPLAEVSEAAVEMLEEEKVPPGVRARIAGTATKIYEAVNGTVPEPESWLSFIAERTTGWVSRLFSDSHVVQGHVRTANPFRRILQLRPGEKLALDQEKNTITITAAADDHLLCSISMKDSHVRATLWAPSADDQRPDVDFTLDFAYLPAKHCSFFSDAEAHMDNVKAFYSRLWLPSTDIQGKNVRSTFTGPARVVSEELVRDLAYCLHSTLPDLELNIPESGVAPLDLCIVLAWEPLVAPLLLPEIRGDILRLVHRSNKFEYLSSAKLKVGDSITTSSTVQSITIEDPGKSVVVRAVIERDGVPLVAITSEFLFKGAFSDYGTTFKHISHPPFELRLGTPIEEAVFKAQSWLKLNDPTTNLANRALTLNLSTSLSWQDKTTYSALTTTGTLTTPSGTPLGTIAYTATACHGDPVLDYLHRKATPVGVPVPLKQPGWTDAASKEIRMPKTNARYARVSRDNNPIHVSPLFAAYAALPGTITHGMHTSAVARAVLQHLAAESDTARFHSWSASFVGMVVPGDRLHVAFEHVAMASGRMVIKVRVRNAETDEAVLEGEAVVEQVATAYVFTGQGSQGVGMGMALYEKSAVARRVWDDVDASLRELYGFSILDIVRTNPTTLTVQFGGPRGRRIRANYLALTIERPDPDSPSYTFHEPRGLLFSTQFAQPAILLQELATFEDMRANGLVQEGALFAGHSLGEYGALAAMARFLDARTLIKVVFYRGLTMQVAMERDAFGRTEYGMAAANPGRVGKWFNETMLKEVVGLVAETSGSLLEIVNLNVEGEQYVCAGKLENLHALTTLLTHLARTPTARTLFAPDNRASLHTLVAQHVAAASALPRPIDLERGAATIPLKGIDVPFHSSHLLFGVTPYRNFLAKSIESENVDVDALVGKYVPNVVAKPFELGAEYVGGVAAWTGSEVLRRVLDGGVVGAA